MIRIQEEDFDVGAEIAELRSGRTDIGAIVSFTGTVRDQAGAVTEMTLEHYPGMTERAISEIIDQARARWNVIEALVIHRVGALKPLDQIVLVVVASEHRGDAFAACEFVMDYLKTRAPFWKKENTDKGTRWVEARTDDEIAAERWRLKG